MKKYRSAFAMAILVCFVGTVSANCGSCGDKAAGAKQCSTEQCNDDCDGCPISKAMAALPKLTYTVGGKVGCCEESAKAMATAAGTHMHFVVGDKEFDGKNDALVALADATEKFVNDFSTPHECSVSGKTSIAGASLSCSVTAAKMAKVAQTAMKQVSMTYKVGEESCHCPVEAGKLAKKSGEKQQFVVGKAATCCPVEARINLAKAKYVAAVEALAKAQPKAEKASASNDS